MTPPAVLVRFTGRPRWTATFRWVGTALLALLLGALAAGPRQLEAGNLGLKLLWLVWWPLLVLSPLLVGRLWCSVCPASHLAGAGARLLGGPRARLAPPERWSRWMPWALMLAVGAVDTGWALAPFAAHTLLLLSLFLAGALAIECLGSRRLWCKVFCPLGAFLRTLSAGAPTAMTADPERCEAACGPEGCAVDPVCPVGLSPRALTHADPCPQCLECVPPCVGASLGYRMRPTFSALSEPSARAATVGALLILGFALAKNLYVTMAWGSVQASLSGSLGTTEVGVRLLSYGVLVAAPAGLFVLLGGRAAASGASLVPLAAFALLSNLAFHTLAKGGQLRWSPSSIPLTSAPTIDAVMAGMVLLGLALSLLAWGVLARKGGPSGLRARLAVPASIAVWGGALLLLALAPKNLLLQCLC